MPAARRRDRNRRGTPRRALHPTTSRLSPRHPEGPSEFVVDVVTEKRTLSNESAGESKAPHALAAKHSLNFEYRMTVVLCFLLLLIFTQYGYVLHVCFAANVNLPLSHTTPSCFSAHRAIRHSATGRPDLLHAPVDTESKSIFRADATMCATRKTSWSDQCATRKTSWSDCSGTGKACLCYTHLCAGACNAPERAVHEVQSIRHVQVPACC